MRDALVVGLVLILACAAVFRPWIGVMLWTWVSIMNPHRYCYGFAVDAPVAAIAAGSTLLGFLLTPERRSPFKGKEVGFFFAFCLWITLTWLVGLDVAGDYPQWNKVMKINLMCFVALSLLYTKKHIFMLLWVCAGSLTLLGIKGGVFTLLSGGAYRVWGPPGTFIEDNNEFAVALIMTIPLLRFFQLQISSRWGRHALTLAMILLALSALGSQSRGALLAISAMTVLLWWRSGSRLGMGLIAVPLGLGLLAFMPDSWFDRMQTIETYDQDSSAMGRISAWWVAWNIGKERIFGVGFNAATPELFLQYSPYPDKVHVAHSIYFQTLGHHGWIGLILFLCIWFYAWRSAAWLRKHAADQPETKWCAQLGGQVQVALIGYFVGGAFLSLAYFDLPYNLMITVVLTRVWVTKQGWKTDPPLVGKGWRFLGLQGAVPRAAPA